MDYDVKDLKLNKTGRDRVEWAYKDMPVLQEINKNLSKKKPLKGISSYKAKELQDIAEQLDISLTLEITGKNKTKKILYSEIQELLV